MRVTPPMCCSALLQGISSIPQASMQAPSAFPHHGGRWQLM